TAPGIVQALGLQAVPTVVALLNGQLAPLFQGVLPKDQVQAAIDQLLKAAVANGMVGRADPAGIESSGKSQSPRQTLGTRRRTRHSNAVTSRPRGRSSTSYCRQIRMMARRKPGRPRRAFLRAPQLWMRRPPLL